VPPESPSLPPFSSSLELAGPDARTDVDPQLVSLPAPPRVGKTVAVVALLAGAVAAFAMALALRRDALYAISPSDPTSIGDLRSAARPLLRAHINRYVRAEAVLGAAGAVRYERPLHSETFRALPVLGRAGDDSVWVEVRVPPGEESGRWEPPHAFVGRLVSFDQADLRHSGLARAIEDVTHARVGPRAFLLIDGDEPQHERWTFFLAVAFVGLAAWNAFAFARLVRRPR
jgi:hypothetical protein